MASNNVGKYEELINKAGTEYEVLRAEAQRIKAERQAAAAELEKLKEEAAELRSRLADFEAGAGNPMSAQEFTDASYRLAWMAGAIKAQQKILGNANSNEREINYELTSLHSKARNDLENMLKADFEATAEGRRAELAAALGSKKVEWPQDTRVMKIPEPQRF